MSMRLVLPVGPEESSMHGLWWKSAHVRLPCLFLRAMLLESRKLLRKEDHAMQYYFRFNRQRGPVNALQMRELKINTYIFQQVIAE
ncbi:hypothetical protein [Rhizobium leguminosarum]|uniref:hypothetical protein n=1 Tax=Rhizobium leguminosarum TaxID=384 RepID=UPI00067EB6F0|nr:hypothetical protein [Rhizobium leguminosarum]